MGKLIRFGVSLDEDLLKQFDALSAERGYGNRSEAIRDLIRNSLVHKEWEGGQAEVAGSLTLVFDHHTSNLSQRLTAVQHDFHEYIVASMHVHLDHDNCLESLVLKGPAPALRELSERLIATKGVKHGKLTIATTGQNLS